MSLSRTTARVLVAAGATLAVAAPAASAASGTGHVLEFGKLTTISGSAGNDGTTFTKAFVGLGRGHVLVTDEGSGALKQEYTTRRGSGRTSTRHRTR
jgi:hypothetical protein